MKTEKKINPPVIIKQIMILPIISLLMFAFFSCSDNIKNNEVTTEGISAPPPSGEESKAEPVKAAGEISLITGKEDQKVEPYLVVDEMPIYPGGDAALLKYIADNTTYPQTAKFQNIQGKVIVRFCVNTNGSVSQASIRKGVSPDIDNEALSEFRPGKQGGKVVPVWYMVPITFMLK
jgi:TonB family protein